jgi:NADH:ubiquinone oxidoreductase subunit H
MIGISYSIDNGSIIRVICIVMVAFTVMLERKVLGGVQLRTRPVTVRYYRAAQTIVDRLKLLTKRTIPSMSMLTSIIFLFVGLVLTIIVSSM